MRVFVTGVGGQLGYDVINELCSRNYECIASDVLNHEDVKFFDPNSYAATCKYIKLDITDEVEVESTILYHSPDVVIHCAAWTQVDAAEDQSNIEKVFQINSQGTENIAKACKKIDAKMVYISTDYVFNGKGEAPWEADCKEYQPINVYGQSKLEGELAVVKNLDRYFIVRIAWVFGVNGNNFINTMLSVGKKYSTLRVVNDQIGTPTYTYDLSRLLADMIETDKYGYYHVTNSGGYISWYDYACKIFEIANYNVEVLPVTTEEYGISKAKRPKNSRLSKEKLLLCGFEELPNWEDALRRYLDIKNL